MDLKTAKQIWRHSQGHTDEEIMEARRVYEGSWPKEDRSAIELNSLQFEAIKDAIGRLEGRPICEETKSLPSR